MKKKALTSSIQLSISLVAIGYAATAVSAEEVRRNSTMLEEVIVTMQKREENIQDVGISGVAFSGEQLGAMGVQTAADVTNITPNFTLVRSYAARGFNTQMTMRGVGQPDFGDVTEATTTTYVDEYYMINSGANDFLLHDIARVEVGRGPQGTVQGRNATGGSVNFVTKRPTQELSAALSMSVGEHNLLRSEGFFNLPINDKLALRFSATTDDNDGYIDNIHPERLYDEQGENKFRAFRAQALFVPTDNLSILVKADYGKMGVIAGQDEQSLQIIPNPSGPGTIEAPTDAFGNNEQIIGAGSKDKVNADGPNGIGHEMTHFMVKADWDYSDDVSFTGLVGMLESKKEAFEDCDDGPLPICMFSNDADQDHWMVELRSNILKPNWRVTYGAQYMEQDVRSVAVTPLWFSTDVSLAALGADTRLAQYFKDHQDLESGAIFGQFEFDLSEKATIIAGLRYTRDRKEFDGFHAVGALPTNDVAIPRTLDDFLDIGDLLLSNNPGITTINKAEDGNLAVFDKSLVNANLQLNYRLTDDVLTYIAYRKGVKSGGFLAGNQGGIPDELRKYKEETNNAYEIGVKSTILDGLGRLNGAIFYYDYKDLQSTSFIGISNVVTNNDAEVLGGEIELTVNPISGLDLVLGLGYVDSEVQDINNTTGSVAEIQDNELPLAPQFSANAMMRYEWAVSTGNVWVQMSARHQSEMYRDSLNNTSIEIPANTFVDANIGYISGDDKWEASVWVKNLGDNRKRINAFDLSSLSFTGEESLAPPRWFGATFKYRWL